MSRANCRRWAVFWMFCCIAVVAVGALSVVRPQYWSTSLGGYQKRVWLAGGALSIDGQKPLQWLSGLPLVGSFFKMTSPVDAVKPRFRVNASLVDINIPLWIVLCVPAFFFFRARRKLARALMEEGRCVCGYDLVGMAHGAPCPECGTAVHDAGISPGQPMLR